MAGKVRKKEKEEGALYIIYNKVMKSGMRRIEAMRTRGGRRIKQGRKKNKAEKEGE